MVAVRAFDQWADLDAGGSFPDDFREIHGNGAWQRFIEVNRDVIEDSWDEYRGLIPELSGGGGI